MVRGSFGVVLERAYFGLTALNIPKVRLPWETRMR